MTEPDHTIDPVPDEAELARALELGRIDAAWSVVWPKALNGDTQAMDQVLELSDARCRLAGLYRGCGSDERTR